MKHALILFASGKGSNASAIIDYCNQTSMAEVALIVTNNADAGVIEVAKKAHIPYLLIDRQTIKEQLLITQILSYEPSLIVLAGFLWKIPEPFIRKFQGRIINIHPALLPSYGGKGMYGKHVHEAVLANQEKASGITIHYVDEHYDNGAVITQVHCQVSPGETPDSLASKVHQLEHFFFPRTIEFLLKQVQPMVRKRHIEIR